MHGPTAARAAPESNAFTRPAMAILDNRTPVCLTIPGLSRHDLMAAQEGLFRFDREVSREDQEKWCIKVPRDPKFDEPDDGAVRKNDKDWKLFFHKRLDLEQLLPSRGIVPTAWQTEWFESMNRIIHACQEALYALCREMDEMKPGYDFAKRAHVARSQSVLRILKYEAHREMHAEWHTDRAGISFPLAESVRGLTARQINSPWKTQIYDACETPETFAFTGDQFAHITHGAVPSLFHCVENCTPDRQERWAIVFFGKMVTKL